MILHYEISIAAFILIRICWAEFHRPVRNMIQCALRNFLITIYLDFQITVLFIYLCTYLVCVYVCIMRACTSDTGSVQKGASDFLEQKL